MILEKGRGLAKGQKILTRCGEQGGTEPFFFFFFFSCRQREENTRALTPGDILRVMTDNWTRDGESVRQRASRSGREGERGEREEGGEGRGERGEESRAEERRRGGEKGREEKKKERRGGERREQKRAEELRAGSRARAGGPGEAPLRRSAFPAAMVYDFRALPQLRAALHNKIYFKTQLKETGRLHVTV